MRTHYRKMIIESAMWDTETKREEKEKEIEELVEKESQHA